MTWDHRGFEESFKAYGDLMLQFSLLKVRCEGRPDGELHAGEEIMAWLRTQSDERLDRMTDYLNAMKQPGAIDSIHHFVLKALAERYEA
jgi:hypothetical protein